MPAATLATTLSSSFSSAIRQRGATYFRGGRVKIVSGSEWELKARVRGTELYRVELARSGRRIEASCTCPFFDDAPCKHVWATLLAADAQTYLCGDDGYRGLCLDIGDDDDYDEEDYDDQFEDLMESSEHDMSEPPRPARRAAKTSKQPVWRQQLAQLSATASYRRAEWPATRELLYVIDAQSARNGRGVQLNVIYRDRKQNGEWSKPILRGVPRELLAHLPNPDDRRILALLAGASNVYGGYGLYDYTAYAPPLGPRYGLTEPQPSELLPLLCRTGRCRLRLHPQDDEQKWLPLRWDEGEPWQLRLQVQKDAAQFLARGALWRGEERMDLSTPVVLLSDGVLFTHEFAARFEHGGAFNWVSLLRDQQTVAVPAEHSAEFISELLQQRTLPPLDLPEELRYDQVIAAPQPRLAVKSSPHTWEREKLRGEVSFDYDGRIVARSDARRGLFDVDARRLLMRDAAAEQAAQARLVELGWRERRDGYGHGTVLELNAKHLPRTVRELTAQGWYVEAQGRKYRQPGQFEFKVGSGVDWFDLQGTLQFETASASLPRLLEAVRRGESAVKLDDGTYGLLPEEWLRKYGALAGMGVVEGDRLRFKRAQAGFLDALLAAQPQVSVDAAFTQARQALQRFSGVPAQDPPKEFKGELRPYQREGLGWFEFLRTFGFGGCLADDMGLGKTVQVLALLEARRKLRVKNVRIGPSLAVVPKSLVFNWKQEAARFAPRVRVLDHTGVARIKGALHFKEYDLLLTTYGTLRNDAEDFKDVRFDYVILDEAQAIKNAKSESAKAARLLQADHCLALSGTPIENHLGELWSLFEFLNPGMLGAASIFQQANGAARTLDDEWRSILSQALRPFFLRRTKTQVLKDLPPKVEQTLYCELDARQRKLYDELRAHYRDTLLKRIDKIGMARAKIQILEALLRLRQAAIHPGLIDVKRVREPSAKLDLLLPQLQEAVDEGHKTLVFSQFTGMLAILRDRLDRDGVAYEYLDGKTRDREARVARFQSRLQVVSGQPEGRRRRAESHRRSVRIPARPVVESGGGSAGHRSRASHWPEGKRFRLSPHRPRHHRRKGAATAGKQARTRRRHFGRRRWRVAQHG